MRFTRIMNLSKKVTKYRERTVLDNYKKDTFISQHCKFYNNQIQIFSKVFNLYVLNNLILSTNFYSRDLFFENYDRNLLIFWLTLINHIYPFSNVSWDYYSNNKLVFEYFFHKIRVLRSVKKVFFYWRASLLEKLYRLWSLGSNLFFTFKIIGNFVLGPEDQNG